MKDNRKNRNLKFIRTKNKLRLGQMSYVYFEKFSNSIDPTEEIITMLINDARNALFRACKLDLPKCELMSGTHGDDLPKDLYTIRVSLRLN